MIRSQIDQPLIMVLPKLNNRVGINFISSKMGDWINKSKGKTTLKEGIFLLRLLEIRSKLVEK